jgi:hypothetical protein
MVHRENEAVNKNGKPPGWFRLPNWALELIRQVGLLAFAVYCVLAKHADERGECWPSIGRIASDCDCSRRSAQRALKLLIDAGFVRSIERKTDSGQTSNLYCLPPISPVTPVTPPRDTSDTGPVSPMSPPPCHPCHPELDQGNKTQGTKKKGVSENLFDKLTWPTSLDTEAGRESLARWIAYKRERGQAYKGTTGPQTLLNQFADGSDSEFQAAVNHSVACNYAGCFAPNSGKPPGKPKSGQSIYKTLQPV